MATVFVERKERCGERLGQNKFDGQNGFAWEPTRFSSKTIEGGKALSLLLLFSSLYWLFYLWVWVENPRKTQPVLLSSRL